jgi:TonB family protein
MATDTNLPYSAVINTLRVQSVRVLVAVIFAPMTAHAQQTDAPLSPPAAQSPPMEDSSSPLTYGELIARAIRKNIVFMEKFHPLDAPRAEVEVRTIPNGTVIGVKVLKPSTMKSWDEAVVRAVWQTDVIPRDKDGRVPQTLLLVFSPR